MSESKEKVVISFDTNANAATKDVQGLSASIEQTTEAVEENSQGFKTLKIQLKEAIIEQQKLSAQYGNTSEQAIKATKAVAGIKDEIGFQKDLVDSYNPDEKFRNLSQTAGVAALALSGVKDGFTALGIESKALDQIIGSAQAILGVTSAVGGLSDAYGILTATQKAKSAADVAQAVTTEAVAVAETEATVATWSFNAALLANPIVAITAGIVAAVAIIYAYVKITGDAVEQEEKLKVASLQLSVAIDNQARSFENNSQYLSRLNDHKANLLKASGASEKQIYAETKALADQELQMAKNYRAEALILEQKAYTANRDNPTEFTEKALENAQENLKKAQEAVSAGYDGLIQLQQQHEITTVQATTDARQKALDALKAHNAELLREQQEANKKRLEEEYAFRLKMIEQADANETEDIEKKQKNKESQEEEIAKSEEDAYNAAEKAKEDSDNYYAGEAEKAIARSEETKRLADVKAQIEKDGKDRMLANGEALAKGMQALAGKNKALQKAAIITEGGINLGKTIANTATAIGSDLKLGFPLSIPAIALDVAVGAMSTASIISGTSKALQAVGGGSISAPSSPTVPTGVNATPQAGFQASSENQIATSISKSQQEQPPIKTYVVGSEVTTQTNLDAKLVKENSFG